MLKTKPGENQIMVGQNKQLNRLKTKPSENQIMVGQNKQLNRLKTKKPVKNQIIRDSLKKG